MDNSRIHFKSKSNDWSTPQDFFDKLDREFSFTLDPCASFRNAKCEKFFTADTDGLAQSWTEEVVFMNPPYGRETGIWIKKAYEESKRGAIVACLIPARTDTAYWHDYIFPYAEVRFVRGRLKFGDHKVPAPFPSAVVIFGNSRSKIRKNCD